MKRFVCWLAVGILTAWLAPVALADWDVGDPCKMHYPQLPDPNGWDVSATIPKILADDFRCTHTGPITDVHFWGSWRQDNIGQLTNIHLSIHADIPDPDGPGPGYSRPGVPLWAWDTETFNIRPIDPPSLQGWYDPASQIVVPGDHQRYFQYNIYIPEPIAFVQQVNTVYWLDVQVTTVGGQWGWKTSVDHWNDDAVWARTDSGSLAWEELRDPITGESLDLAFVITPEPAAGLLLLLGLGFGCRRR